MSYFLPFHTAHGVLKVRILKWFAIPFSSGPRFVRTLHHDPWVALHSMAHSFIELDKAVIHMINKGNKNQKKMEKEERENIIWTCERKKKSDIEL